MYLAQNDLFEPLKRDLPIPALCVDGSLDVGAGSLYGVNMWMGPRGSVSPLHYDPLDNLLMQFGGRKRALLFPATEADPTAELAGRKDQRVGWYYAGPKDGGGGQYNTSAVDAENPDLDKFPLFSEAPPAIECILAPGDTLFIPGKWWHHVRSLDSSVSANIWWR